MMGAPNLIADTMDCGLSYSVISYLKKLSQQVKTQVSLSVRQSTFQSKDTGQLKLYEAITKQKLFKIRKIILSKVWLALGILNTVIDIVTQI